MGAASVQRVVRVGHDSVLSESVVGCFFDAETRFAVDGFKADKSWYKP